MAVSQVELCNLALSRSGGHRISQITSLGEASNEARQCAVKLPHLIKTSLRAYPWRFAGKKVILAACKLEGVHNLDELSILYGSKVLYQYPNDCLVARHVYSARGAEEQGRDFHVELGSDGTKLIISDVNDAVLIYTSTLTDASLWDPMFYDALAWQLAAELCIGLGNDMEKAKQLELRAIESFERAKVVDAKESSHNFFRFSYQNARK